MQHLPLLCTSPGIYAHIYTPQVLALYACRISNGDFHAQHLPFPTPKPGGRNAPCGQTKKTARTAFTRKGACSLSIGDAHHRHRPEEDLFQCFKLRRQTSDTESQTFCFLRHHVVGIKSIGLIISTAQLDLPLVFANGHSMTIGVGNTGDLARRALL